MDSETSTGFLWASSPVFRRCSLAVWPCDTVESVKLPSLSFLHKQKPWPLGWGSGGCNWGSLLKDWSFMGNCRFTGNVSQAHTSFEQCFKLEESPGNVAGNLATGLGWWAGPSLAMLASHELAAWPFCNRAGRVESVRSPALWGASLGLHLDPEGWAHEPGYFGLPSACQSHQRTACAVPWWLTGGVPCNASSWLLLLD